MEGFTLGLFGKLMLALIFGAAIGLERESSKQNEPHVGGIRTFALVSLIGAIAGIFFLHQFELIASIIVIGFVVLLISNYVIEGIATKDFGITSELSALTTFFIGLLVMLGIVPLQIIMAILVMLIFVLSQKPQTTQLVAGLSRHEIQAFISYAIIALVALPILPDYSYRLHDIPALPHILKGLNIELGKFEDLDLINPQKIWIVVVLITGIDVFGYILGRVIGTKRGFALTSFMAGFVSSTSATQSLAQRSKYTSFVNHLVGAALLANLASFLQIILLVGPLNPAWLVSISPAILLMVITAGIFAWVYFKNNQPTATDDHVEKKTNPIFSLAPALKFAGLLIIIKVITKICLIEFGESGFIISSIIASFAGIDAIMVNLAEMAGQTISLKFALITFLTINATNLLSKSVYAYLQGNRSFAIKFLIAVIGIIAIASISLLF